MNTTNMASKKKLSTYVSNCNACLRKQYPDFYVTVTMLMYYLNQVNPFGLKAKIKSLSAILILVMSLF